ncbi:hypothetical protein [Fusobacterium polymorphum]|nr:hypothetical protein [Fusobacterium polymorphum]
MRIEVYIKFYNKIDIENFINKHPETVGYFKSCGLFLDNYFLLIDNEYMGVNNPYTQLKYLLKDFEATKNGIDLQTYEEIDDYESEIEDEFIDINYSYKLPNYISEI